MVQHATEIDPAMAARYGNRFLVDEVPGMALPDEGMPAPGGDAADLRRT